MSKSFFLAIVTVSSILVVGCTQPKPPTPEESLPQENTTQSMGNYTLSDVAQHNNADDCWLAIEGGVYDVTQFIADKKHPGGAAILEGCGKDATELFNTRPMGSQTPHSEAARSLLSTYKIGELN